MDNRVRKYPDGKYRWIYELSLKEDRSIFISYINRKKSTGEIAAEIGAGVDTTRNRIYKIKLEVKENMLEYLEGRL